MSFFFFARKLAKQKVLCLRMMKNHQHKHKGKPYTLKKSQDAATMTEDAITNTVLPVKLRPQVYLPEEPGEFQAQEAAGGHQEGGESREALARGAVRILGPFQGQNFINKEKV